MCARSASLRSLRASGTGWVMLLACVSHSSQPAIGPDRAGRLGEACMPSYEADPRYPNLCHMKSVSSSARGNARAACA